MKKSRMCKLLLLPGVAFVLLSVSGVLATSAAAITLENLFDGGEIIAGDKLFSDWKLLRDDFGADLSQIEVSPLLDPLNQGLQYVDNGQWNTFDGGGPRFEFTYDVTVLNPSLAITDASMDLVDFLFAAENSGYIEIQHALFPPSLIVGVNADNVFGIFRLTNTEEFAPDFAPQTEFNDIETLITISGDITSLDIFEVRYSQSSNVPEPSIMFLLGSGLLGVGALKRTFST